MQRQALAIIAERPGISTAEVAFRLFGRDLNIPGLDEAQDITDGQLSTVRRAVRSLRARGLVQAKECGRGMATWHELTAK